MIKFPADEISCVGRSGTVASPTIRSVPSKWLKALEPIGNEIPKILLGIPKQQPAVKQPMRKIKRKSDNDITEISRNSDKDLCLNMKLTNKTPKIDPKYPPNITLPNLFNGLKELKIKIVKLFSDNILDDIAPSKKTLNKVANTKPKYIAKSGTNQVLENLIE